MIRLTHLTGSKEGAAFTLEKNVVRIGRSADCDIRFDADRDPNVSYHHGEIVSENDAWFVVDTDSDKGILLNGKKVSRAALKDGDRIRIGAPNGPELKFEKVADKPQRRRHTDEEMEAVRTDSPEMGKVAALRAQTYRKVTELSMRAVREEPEAEDEDEPELDDEEAREEDEEEDEAPTQVPTPVAKPARPDKAKEREKVAKDSKEKEPKVAKEPRESKEKEPEPRPRERTKDREKVTREPEPPVGKGGRDADTAKLAAEAAKRVAEERERAGGINSGHTMFIMADVIEQVHQRTRRNSRRKWVTILSVAGGVAVMLLMVMGTVIVSQRRQIQGLVQEKQRIDQRIAAIHQKMADESTPPEELDALEAELEQLSGSAEAKQRELSAGSESARKAAAEADTSDELDREIRELLKKFNAETYAVPPIFKQALREQIAELQEKRALGPAWERRDAIWPLIEDAFRSKKLPVELGYIAWAESAFFLPAGQEKTHAGAIGIWQFIPRTGIRYGLRVDSKVDDRLDPRKATYAAAEYLADLMTEFDGKDFMLAIASYNLGEDKVRAALHKNRRLNGEKDFWSLYRQRLIPKETQEYVPRVLAAAIVFGHPEKYKPTKE